MAVHKLTDPKEVERICQKYLDDCKQSRDDNMVTLKNNSRVTYGSWPSTEGLALALKIGYSTLMRYISQAPDEDERERTYGDRESVSPSNDLALDSSIALDNPSSLSTPDSECRKIEECEGKEGYENAQKAIRECLARVRLEIISQITDAADSGMIDSKVVQLRLSRLGIAAKVEQDNTKKIEFVNYDADDMKALFT